MAALSGTTKKYVIIGVAGLAFILGVVLIYIQYNTLAELRTEVEEEEIAVDEAHAHLNRLISHRERADEYEERLNYARGKMPDSSREEEVLRYIHRLVDEHGLKALDISFEDRYEEEGYTVMPLSLTLEGSYSGIRRMLNNLRRGERAVRVDDLSFAHAEAGGSELQINVFAKTFYRP